MVGIVRSGVFAALSLAMVMPAWAGDKEAGKYFERGEKYFNLEEYDEALEWYQKAVGEVARDGKIELKRQKKVQRTATGRGFSEDVTYDSTFTDYYPNRRIAFIRKKQKETNPPSLSLDVAYRDASGDGRLEAGEKAKLVINVHNSGAVAENVYLSIDSDGKGLKYDNRVAVGDVAPNQTVSREVAVTATKQVGNGAAGFTVVAKEKDDFNSKPATLAVNTQGFLPPNLVVADIVIKDANANAKIEQVELVEVSYRLRNIGIGAAHAVQAEVVASGDVRLVDESQRTLNFDAIAAGDSKLVNFTFYTNKKINVNDKIPLAIRVGESEGEYGVFQDLKLVMGEGYASQVDFAAAPVPAAVPVAAVPLADVDLNIPTGSLVRPDAIAVVIGNTNYIVPGVPAVKYAVRDAKTMKKYLVSAMGFREGNIIYVEDASAAKFSEIFGKDSNSYHGKLYDWVKPGKSDVFVFYSGHGAPDIDGKSAYFVPVDADPNYIANTGYAVDTFYTNLAKVPAKSMTVVLDACFSGNSDDGFLLKNISPALIKYNMPKAKLDQATLMTSAGKEEVSSWYPEKGHGLYTYFFLKGLGGAADSNGDKQVSTAELATFVKDNVSYMARRLNGKNQTPTFAEAEEKVLAAY